jgi:hypothetical protein
MCGINWQPIETAPKDGTAILVYGADPCVYADDYGCRAPYFVAYWDNSDTDEPIWRYASYDGGYYGACYKPTHWMPLPDPPSAVINALGLDPDDMHKSILDDLQCGSVDQPEKCRRKSRHE